MNQKISKMIDKVKGLLWMIFLLCVCQLSVAQNIQAEIEAIQKHYLGLQSYQYHVTTKLYGPDDYSKAHLVKKSVFKKRGESFIYTIDHITMLVNDNYSITCNSDEKIVVCNKREKTQAGDALIPDIGKVLTNFESVEYKGYVNGLKCYYLKRPEAVNHLIEFYFDASRSEVKKLVYHFNEDVELGFGKVVMEFSSSKNKALTNKMFSEKRYVRVENGKVKLNEQYKDYYLVLGDKLEYAVQE